MGLEGRDGEEVKGVYAAGAAVEGDKALTKSQSFCYASYDDMIDQQYGIAHSA